MVDTFLLLALARTGDQLQGIKKGVLELADIVTVNKADGPHEKDALAAARELSGALRMLGPPGDWTTPVLTCSAATGARLDEVWDSVQAHRAMLATTGGLERRRHQQAVDWFWALCARRSDGPAPHRSRHSPVGHHAGCVRARR